MRLPAAPSRRTLTLTRALAGLLPCALLVGFGAAAAPGAPAKAGVDWALQPGDDLSRTTLERIHGVDEADLPTVEPFWQDGMLYTADSHSVGTLTQQGLPPVPAMNYDPSPGILYLALDGITIRPTCGSGDSANAALDCSPLVDSETTFPAYGSGQQQSALFAQLQEYYEPFNLLLTTSRPPSWVPYTMAVVGGSAGLAGQENGVCGIANVACDGLKRNHVSLTFPQSCNGTAATAAQETSHNWGLEHTNNQTDLLYPFNSGGGFKTFVDDCMDISHATGDGITQCGYIHEIYCAAGDGEQQNTFQELMGIFGPREVDTVAPVITSMFPEDGATYGNEDSFTITASVEEDSNFLAARWTLEGGGEMVTRCTNNTCDQDYNLGVGFDPNEVAWDFVTLTGAPAGEYTLTFEVMDAYGQTDSQTITISVVEGETPETTGTDSDSDSDSDSGDTEGGSDSDSDDSDSDDSDSDDSDSGGTDSGDDDDEGSANDEDDSDEDDSDEDDDEGDTDPGQGGGDPQGCGCDVPSAPPLSGGLALFVIGLLVRRRR